MKNKVGKLYGVGVGPGATDLITLRAVNVLNSVEVIAIPKSSDYTRPFAWRICSPIVKERENLEKLFLLFPMTKNPKILIPAWEKAFTEIQDRLKKGLNVAFITQGDPGVYSSWSYLLDECEKFKEQLPSLEIEIVPGVSSITAIPAEIKIPLADGMERFCVFPATYGLDDLPNLIEEFDTIVLTKVGKVVAPIIKILEEKKLLEKAKFISYGTTKDQQIVQNLKEVQIDNCAYFSMIVISIRKRKGILRGQTPSPYQANSDKKSKLKPKEEYPSHL